MLQRQIEDRDWRYDTPFAGGSVSGPFEVQPALKTPQQAYRPTQKQAPYYISNPFDGPPASSPPTSQPLSRNPSIALRTPPTPHSARRPSNTRSLRSDGEKVEGIQSARSAHSSRRPTPDPEKAIHGPSSKSSVPSSNPISYHSTVIYEEDEEDESSDPKYHTVWILVYLSAFNPLLTTGLTLYTLLATLTILILSPLCFCTSSRPIKSHFHRFLLPPLHFQLGLIYSRYEPDETSPPHSAAMLILVNALAPVVALGVSTAAWVAAAFWMFANILGNPNKDQGQEKIDEERNEGQAAVLGVRKWWEAWLIRGLRN